MGRAERVVFALGALGEARQAAALAQGADAVAPAGEDLVRIGLVADVPDQAVVRRVEHVVQGHGQLDHAQPGAEMAAGDRHGVDGLLAQFVGQLA